jgi:glycogen operon protein
LGEGGYQVGNFPPGWAEWNGIYRDNVRSFWRGDAGQIDDLAFRLTGSSDLYERSGRRPHASVNFVTAHDGFTLRDLVSYNEKHNEGNGEENRDGHDHNISWNCGAEGETDDAEINALRDRQVRNFLATLLLSQGVPMLVAGDETGRTQRGNNNAWCQDNEISWLDWDLDQPRRDLLEFTRELIRIFHRHPVLRRRKFFQGRQIRGAEIKDVSWFRADGRELTEADWKNESARVLGVRLAGDAIDEVDVRGRQITGDTLFVILNAHARAVSFHMPAHRPGVLWEQMIDTREGRGRRRTRRLVRGGTSYRVEARSLALFRLQTGAAAAAQEPAHETEPPPSAEELRAEEAAGPSEAEILAVAPTAAEPSVESVYCERAGSIVPLVEGFCRACSEKVTEGDGRHHPVTPEVLKRLDYATTEVPETEAQEKSVEVVEEQEEGDNERGARE